MHILIVEAEPLLRSFLHESLSERADVACTAQAHAALAMLEREPCDVVVAASNLGRGHPSGAWLLGEVGRRWPSTRRVLTGGPAAPSGVQWLPRPFSVADLVMAIERERATVRVEMPSLPAPTPRNYGAGLRGLGTSVETRPA